MVQTALLSPCIFNCSPSKQYGEHRGMPIHSRWTPICHSLKHRAVPPLHLQYLPSGIQKQRATARPHAWRLAVRYALSVVIRPFTDGSAAAITLRDESPLSHPYPQKSLQRKSSTPKLPPPLQRPKRPLREHVRRAKKHTIAKTPTRITWGAKSTSSMSQLLRMAMFRQSRMTRRVPS